MKGHAPVVASGQVPWSFPWYEPWRATGKAVELDLAAGLPLHDALNRRRAAPVRFVPHTDLPPDTPYEKFVSDTGHCPIRPGLHDFFNGLCWTHFPATKGRLNQMQAAEIALDGVRPQRGAVRDALTLLDENAAFLRAPQVLWDALLAKRWRELFVNLRPVWREARLVLFGHALLEKQCSPRKPVTAHVYRVYSSSDAIKDFDAWVASDLNAVKLEGKPFAPLPVLGVPGWWSANEDASFYDDVAVFRAQRELHKQMSRNNRSSCGHTPAES